MNYGDHIMSILKAGRVNKYSDGGVATYFNFISIYDTNGNPKRMPVGFENMSLNKNTWVLSANLVKHGKPAFDKKGNLKPNQILATCSFDFKKLTVNFTHSNVFEGDNNLSYECLDQCFDYNLGLDKYLTLLERHTVNDVMLDLVATIAKVGYDLGDRSDTDKLVKRNIDRKLNASALTEYLGELKSTLVLASSTDKNANIWLALHSELVKNQYNESVATKVVATKNKA